MAESGTLKFAPGETAKTVKVLVVNDTIHEGPETFSLKLSDLVGATTLDPVGTATIDDNDAVTRRPRRRDATTSCCGTRAAGGDLGRERGHPDHERALARIRGRTGKTSERATSTTYASRHLWQNTNGAVAIWEMDGTSVTGGTVVANPGANWKAVGTGDFNDDGHSDILLQNTSGAVAIWDMNGTSMTSGAAVSNPGPNWKAVGTGDFNDDGHSEHSVAEYQRQRCDLGDERGGDKRQRPRGQSRAELERVGTGDFNDDSHSDICGGTPTAKSRSGK